MKDGTVVSKDIARMLAELKLERAPMGPDIVGWRSAALKRLRPRIRELVGSGGPAATAGTQVCTFNVRHIVWAVNVFGAYPSMPPATSHPLFFSADGSTFESPFPLVALHTTQLGQALGVVFLSGGALDPVTGHMRMSTSMQLFSLDPATIAAGFGSLIVNTDVASDKFVAINAPNLGPNGIGYGLYPLAQDTNVTMVGETERTDEVPFVGSVHTNIYSIFDGSVTPLPCAVPARAD